MKEINGYWVDKNNNRWNVKFYTEQQAKEYSEYMIKYDSYNNLNCINCRDCSYCSHCSDCSDCRYCSDCSGCRYCSDCSGCSYCSHCSHCINCSNCSSCSDCSNCSSCINCSDCSSCINCSDCRKMHNNPITLQTNKIGSRKETTFFHFYNGEIYVACGCFYGTLEKFKTKVEETHGDNEHGKVYNKWIDITEIFFGEF